MPLVYAIETCTLLTKVVLIVCIYLYSYLIYFYYRVLAYSYAEAIKTDDALQEKDNLHYDVRNI